MQRDPYRVRPAREAELIELPDRPLLASPEAEQSVLGGLLLDNGTWPRARAIVSEPDFYRADHRLIFQHISQLLEHGKPADALTVAESLERSAKLAEIGGIPYLGSLAANTPSAANIIRYCEIVAERARRRELAAIGAELMDKAVAPNSDVEEIRAAAGGRIAAVRPVATQRSNLDWPQLVGKEPPARRWATAAWLGFGHVTLMPGASGVGKTLCAQQWISALALGRDFVGHSAGALRCLMWACEDEHDELWRRQLAIARWLDVGLEAFGSALTIESRHGRDNTLVCRSDFGRLTFTPLIEELRQQAGDYRAEVVVLDNAAQLYGADENDRHEVTAFLNALTGALPGRAVMLLAHPSRATGSEFSGSGAWEAVARTRLYLGRTLPDQKAGDDAEDGGEVRYLARRKANYSERDWRRLQFRDGVLVPDDPPDLQGGIVGHIREQTAERVVLTALRRLTEMAIRSTESTASPQFLPKLILDYKLGEGHARQDLVAAMRRLMTADRIRRAEVGKYSNRTPMMGLVAAA